MAICASDRVGGFRSRFWLPLAWVAGTSPAMTASGFRLVPVLDLMGGAVVAAKGGDRANYRPIETPLATGSAPADVLAGLLRLHPFETIYIADLDAIAGRGDHHAVIAALAARFPNLSFWIDAGFADASRAGSALAIPGACAVLGSESLQARGIDGPRAIGAPTCSAPMARGPGPGHGEEDRLLLSLDFRGGAFLGPPDLLAQPEFWPSRVIVMTLARVGSGEGPDFERLDGILARAGERDIYAAGGVRGPEDIAALRRRGVAGALVSTALHSGALAPDDFASVCNDIGNP